MKYTKIECNGCGYRVEQIGDRLPKGWAVGTYRPSSVGRMTFRELSTTESFYCNGCRLSANAVVDFKGDMKYQGNCPKLLERTYLNRVDGIEVSLMALLEYIGKTKHTDYPVSWAEVGSLGHVNEELANLVKFLGA